MTVPQYYLIMAIVWGVSAVLSYLLNGRSQAKYLSWCEQNGIKKPRSISKAHAMALCLLGGPVVLFMAFIDFTERPGW